MGTINIWFLESYCVQLHLYFVETSIFLQGFNKMWLVFRFIEWDILIEFVYLNV